MKILVLPGDGIVEEITKATMTFLNVLTARAARGRVKNAPYIRDGALRTGAVQYLWHR